MNKITQNTIGYTSIFKNLKKAIFIIQYRISQRINQIFEILGPYCFAFTALEIDKTFTQRNFLPTKIEINLPVIRKSVYDTEMCADS